MKPQPNTQSQALFSSRKSAVKAPVVTSYTTGAPIPQEAIYERNQALARRVLTLKKSRCADERRHGKALERTMRELAISHVVKVKQ